MGKKRIVVVRLQLRKKGEENNDPSSIELDKLIREFAEYKKKTNLEIDILKEKVSQLWDMVRNLSNRFDKDVSEMME